MAVASGNLRWIGAAATITVYAFLAHYTNRSGNAALGVLLALAPILLALSLYAVRSPHRLTLLLVPLAGFAALLAWPYLRQHYGWIYWLEHETLQLTLFAGFARSLFAGRQPLCARYAEALHGTLDAAHSRYARSVTIAWAIFFGVMIAISTTLFFLFPLPIWSIFSNFVFLPLVALMFIAEYRLRRHLLADIEHRGILETVRIFRKTT